MSAPSHLPSLSLDDGSIHWRKATSEDGMSFEIGVLKAAMEAHSNLTPGTTTAIKPAGGTQEAFTIHVDWPVVDYTDRTWIFTSSHVHDVAAISGYSLYKESDESVYTILCFQNELHYNYVFTDKAKKIHPVDTSFNGTHFVRYHSLIPTIKKIEGYVNN